MATFGPTPSSLAQGLLRNPKYARGYQMVQAGSSTAPVQHWAQGLARLAQSAVGTWQMDKGEKDEEAKKKERAQKLASALQKMNAGDMGGAMADFAAVDEDGSTSLQLGMYGQQRQDRKADTAEERAYRDRKDAEERAWRERQAAANRGPGPGPVAALDLETGKVSFVDAMELRRNPNRYAPPDQAKGQMPFSGNSMDAQSANILLTGDPNSPAYRAAYAMMAQPKMQMNPDGTFTPVMPDMGAYRPPGQQAQASPQGGPMPGTEADAANIMNQLRGQQPQQPPQMPGAQPPMGQPAMPNAPPQPSMPGQTQAPGMPTLGAPQGSPRIGQAEAAKLRQAQVDAQTLVGALDSFTGAVGKAGIGDRAAAVVGINTPGAAEMNTKWANAALLSKSESLYNLGVLNGPDLEIIRKTLSDPSTVSGALTGNAGFQAQTKAIKELIQQRLNAAEAKAGLPLTQFGKPDTGTGDTPAQPSVDDLLNKYAPR